MARELGAQFYLICPRQEPCWTWSPWSCRIWAGGKDCTALPTTEYSLRRPAQPGTLARARGKLHSPSYSPAYRGMWLSPSAAQSWWLHVARELGVQSCLIQSPRRARLAPEPAGAPPKQGSGLLAPPPAAAVGPICWSRQLCSSASSRAGDRDNT